MRELDLDFIDKEVVGWKRVAAAQRCITYNDNIHDSIFPKIL